MSDRLSLATRVMKARRNSTCPACRGPVHVGNQIARLTDPPQWVHIGCVPAVRDALSAIAASYPKGRP